MTKFGPRASDKPPQGAALFDYDSNKCWFEAIYVSLITDRSFTGVSWPCCKSTSACTWPCWAQYVRRLIVLSSILVRSPVTNARTAPVPRRDPSSTAIYQTSSTKESLNRRSMNGIAQSCSPPKEVARCVPASTFGALMQSRFFTRTHYRKWSTSLKSLEMRTFSWRSTHSGDAGRFLSNRRICKKSTFTTHLGTYCYTRMCFGLLNAPDTFQRVLDIILSGGRCIMSLVYLNNVIIISKYNESHLEHLYYVLTLL